MKHDPIVPTLAYALSSTTHRIHELAIAKNARPCDLAGAVLDAAVRDNELLRELGLTTADTEQAQESDS